MAGFSLATFFAHLVHLKQNELGHSVLGNEVVSLVDHNVEPLMAGVAAMIPMSPVEIEVSNVLATIFQALVNAHNSNNTPPSLAAPAVTKAVSPVVLTGSPPLMPLIDPSSESEASGLTPGGLNG